MDSRHHGLTDVCKDAALRHVQMLIVDFMASQTRVKILIVGILASFPVPCGILVFGRHGLNYRSIWKHLHGVTDPRNMRARRLQTHVRMQIVRFMAFQILVESIPASFHTLPDVVRCIVLVSSFMACRKCVHGFMVLQTRGNSIFGSMALWAYPVKLQTFELLVFQAYVATRIFGFIFTDTCRCLPPIWKY